MKRLSALLVASMLSSYGWAQHRYHVEQYNPNGDVQTSNTNRHRVGSQATAPIKSFGSPMIPVVLVQFPDLKFVSDVLNMNGVEHSDENVRLFYHQYCNGTGIQGVNFTYTNGSYGSASDYFIEQSDSLFKPLFQVIGPVTLPKSYAFYGKDASNTKDDVNIDQFYKDALTLAIQQYPHWEDFDNNGDGKYDFVYFIYAGEGQNAYGKIDECKKDGNPEKADLIWPKEWTHDFTVDGYKFGGYGMTNEIHVSRTEGVGTMCHELSHGLGLPDMYDTNNEAFGMDHWDLMDSGNYCRVGRCPCAYSAYERDFMGWRKLVELPSLTEPQTITLEPIQKGGVGYKLVNPANKNEYYILENRQTIGFDTYFGWVTNSHDGFKIIATLGYNHGMLVTHVDYSQSEWNGNKVNTEASHQRMTILPADGKLISSIDGYDETYFRSMAGDLYPGYMKVTEIPSERFGLYTGGTLPINITNIRENEDLSITVEINGGDPALTAVADRFRDDTSDDDVFYNLNGQRINGNFKGLMIKNGKKVWIKK